jgi:NADH dehydrogenase
MRDAAPATDLGRVLVTGANGHLGRALIARLASGRAPRAVARALVRSERAAAAVRALPEAPEVVVVDPGDADALARAAEGCQSAVHLVGILKEAPGTSYEDAHERTARALAAAAPRAGFHRVVYVSILGASADSPNPCLASKARAEAILLAPPLETTVLRVPMVLGGDDPATAALRARARARLVALVRGGASLEQPIDAADVVEAIVAALVRPGLAGRVLDLAGPESLPRRALLERAAALAGAPGPTVLPIPLFAVRAFAALAERFAARPPLTRAMLDVLEHDDRVDPAPACAALGIALTPLDDTLRRCLAGG